MAEETQGDPNPVSLERNCFCNTGEKRNRGKTEDLRKKKRREKWNHLKLFCKGQKKAG